VRLSADDRAPESPYKGLTPYDEEDAPFFFGRETEQDIIGANLQAYRLTLLYGASGVGKSSVLRAGVAHHLRGLAERTINDRGTPEFVVVVFASWRDDPVATLLDRVRDSITNAAAPSVPQLPPAGPTLADTLAAWTTALDSDLLVILDQFEEYFLYHPHEDGDGSFAIELPRAIDRPGLRANFLISIREDSLAKLDRFKGRIPNLFDNYLRVDHLDQEAARAAIEKPIEQFNRSRSPSPSVSIEPALIAAVLDQVRTGRVLLGDTGVGTIARDVQPASADQRIETPYLQLVMTRLWKEERAAGSNVLRLDTLSRLGGADRIVRTHLDDVMSAFTPSERQAAARVFRYLVTPSGTKIAHSISDLADYAALPQVQLEPIAEKLSGGDVRIIRPVAPSPDRPTAPRYEIFHDVLAAAILDWRQRTEVERRGQVEKTLEPLHGQAWSLTRLLLAASVLLAAPLTVALINNPETAVWMLPGWFLGTVALAGLSMLFVTSGRLLKVWRRITHAVDVGFRWPAIVDVLADRRGDIGDLVTTAGTYGSISADQAGRIRLLRRIEVALMLAAAGAPLIGLLAVVSLGSRGVVAPSTTPTVVFGPSLILLMCGIAVLSLGLSMSRRAVSLFKRSSGGPESHRLQRSASDWFEGILPDPPLPSSARRAHRVVWLIRTAIVVLNVAVTLVTLPVVIVTVIGQIFSEIAAPRLDTIEARLRILRVAQPQRLPLDSTISPLAAGQAYYTLAVIGSSEPPRSYELPRPRLIESWFPKQANNPFGKPEVLERVVSRAGGRFSAEETAFLEQMASHPGLAEAAVIARASRVDYLGARLKSNHNVGPFALPFPSSLEMRGVAQAHVAKAALELSRGQRTEAEATLREGISFGLSVATEGHTLLEALIGAVVVEVGLKGLEDFYSLTGRAPEAAALRADREAVTASVEVLRKSPIREVYLPSEAINARSNESRIVRDSQRVQGERWEAVNFLAMAPCSNAQEIIFGPADELSRTLDVARTSLVRFPSEQRLLENILSTTGLLPTARSIEVRGVLPLSTEIISRGFDRLFGNPRLSNCGLLMISAGVF
jgi:hypothetical protein